MEPFEKLNILIDISDEISNAHDVSSNPAPFTSNFIPETVSGSDASVGSDDSMRLIPILLL